MPVKDLKTHKSVVVVVVTVVVMVVVGQSTAPFPRHGASLRVPEVGVAALLLHHGLHKMQRVQNHDGLSAHDFKP